MCAARRLFSCLPSLSAQGFDELVKMKLVTILMLTFSSQVFPFSAKDLSKQKSFSNVNCFAVNRREVMNRSIDIVCATLVGANVQCAAEAASSPQTRRKDLPEEYRQGTAALSESDENSIVPRDAYIKLPSGVIYADLRVGNGETIKEGSRVNMNWVLRKSNGYFVDSSEVQGVPFIFTVGDKKTVISGVNEGVRGMKSGGTRRLLIPPSLAYVDGLEDGKPGPLPLGFGPRQQMRRVQNIRKDVPGEYVFLEVQITRVR